MSCYLDERFDSEIPEDLALAVNFLEYSYLTPGYGLSLATAMSGLEALLTAGKAEVGYSLRRNVGVLLAGSEVEFRSIMREIKGLYELRSKVIHHGRERDVTKESVLLARSYLRRSILAAWPSWTSKDDFVSGLDSTGLRRTGA